MGSDEKRYETSDGQKASLFTMVRVEPEWAASRIRAGEEAIAERDRLRRELEALREWAEGDLLWREEAGDVYGVTPLRQIRQIRRRIDAILTGEGER